MSIKIDLFKNLRTNNILRKVFFLIFICLLISVNSFSQTETCRKIGNGSIESKLFPFNTGNRSSFSQQIYLAEDLFYEDIKAGDLINTISFNYQGDNSIKRPISIYIGNTATSKLDQEWIPLNLLTKVLDSECLELSKTADNWTKIPLTTPFKYTGGNIVIAVLMNKEDASDQADCFTELSPNPKFLTHNASYLAISRHLTAPKNTSIKLKNGIPEPITNQHVQSLQTRNNIKFCKTVPNCPLVSAIIATEITDKSITLDWTNGNSENSWTIEYGESGFPKGSGKIIQVSSHPFEVNNLSGTNDYDFYIKANCSENDNEIWSMAKTFTTSCGTIDKSRFIEDFTENNFSLDCWTIIDKNNDGKDNGEGKWKFIDNQARYRFNSQNQADDWLISPKIKVKQNYVFDFQYKAHASEHAERFSVWIIKNSIENLENASKVLDITTENSNQIKINPISLQEFLDDEVFIAIKCHSQPDKSNLYIDNFSVYQQSSENNIINFYLDSQTKPAVINTDSHKVYIQVSIFTDLTSLTPSIKVSEYASIEPSDLDRDFSQNVTYMIKAENGDIQEWTISVTKATDKQKGKDILAFSFPHQEGETQINKEKLEITAFINWEHSLDEISPDIQISPLASIYPDSGAPQNFNNIFTYKITAEDGTYQIWKVNIKHADTPIGANCEKPVIVNLSEYTNPYHIFGDTNKGMGDIYNNTALDLNDEGPDKIYKINVEENSMYNINLISNTRNVGIAIFKDCPNENQLIKMATNGFDAEEISLNDIVLKQNTDYFLMVDNQSEKQFHKTGYIESYTLTFTKNEYTACASPSSLNISEISQTSAKISWEKEIEETVWEIKYGNKNFIPENQGTSIITEEYSFYNLSDLDKGSEYDIYIRSKCSETETADWKGPFSLKTLENCPIPRDVKISDITSNSIKISWNGYNATDWILEYKLSYEDYYKIVNTSSTTHTLTNLDTASKYKLRLKAKCGQNEDSQYSDELIFSTLCQNISELPYIEDFENFESNKSEAFPTCWSRPVTYTYNSVIYPSIGEGSYKMPTRYLTFVSEPSKPTIAATPKLDTDINELILEFKLRPEGPASGGITLGIMSDPNDENTFVQLIPLSTQQEDNFNHKIKLKDFNISGENIAIAFKHFSIENDYFYWIDDLKLRKISSEKEILSFNTENLIEEAFLNFTDHKITASLSYSTNLEELSPEILISEHARIFPKIGTPQDFTSPVEYTVTAEDNSQQVWTVFLSKASNPSNENDIISFTFSNQEGETTIKHQNHEIEAKIHWQGDLTNISPEIEISKFASISPSSNTSQNFLSTKEYFVKAENGETQKWKINIKHADQPLGVSCENPFLINLSQQTSPYILEGETTKGFGNEYKHTDLGSHDNGPDKIYKLSVDQNQMFDIKINSITNYVGIGLFLGCPSENIPIKLQTNDSNGGELTLKDIVLSPNLDYFLMVDNNAPNPDYLESYDLTFTKNQTPNCSSPTQIEISEISINTAKVNWLKALNEENWEIKYGNKGFSPSEDGNLKSVNSNTSLLLSELMQDTEYDLYIRSICSDQDTSNWKGPKYFKTLEACPPPTDIIVEQITTNSAYIKWNSDNASNWVLEYKLSTKANYESISINTNFFSLQNLEPAKSYQIRIKAKCGHNEESKYSEIINISTHCNSITNLPYTEDFENYGSANSNAFPPCWYRPNTNTFISILYPSIVENISDMSSRVLRFQSEIGSPTFAASTNIAHQLNNLVLEFRLKREDANSGEIQIGIMDDPSDTESFIKIKSIKPNNNEANDYIIKLKDYNITENNKSIAFKHISDDNILNYYLDNIKIRNIDSSKNIISFSTNEILEDAHIDEVNRIITGIISYNGNIHNQIPNITIPEFATINPPSLIPQDFSSPVEYTITAEDGSYKVWTVNLSKASEKSSAKEILSFSFPNQVGNSIIDSQNGKISAIAKWNQDLKSINPEIEISNFASLTSENQNANDFSDTVKYKIEAQDKSFKIWEVTITKDQQHHCSAEFSIPFLETFSPESQTINCWTIIDKNHDADLNSGNGGWKIDTNLGYAEYKHSNSHDADDWIISPKINISRDAYLSLKYRNASNYSEKFSILIIKSSDYDNGISEIIQPTISANTYNTWKTIDELSLTKFIGENIHIAIKCESEKAMNYLQIKDISISPKVKTFKINSSAGPNGSIFPNGEIHLEQGDSKKFAITPIQGYKIDKLIDNNETIYINDNSYTISNISADHNIHVSFKKIDASQNFTIIAKVTDNKGLITPEFSSVASGENIELSIIPKHGYKLNKLIDNNSDNTDLVTSSNKYVLSGVSSNHNIFVSFKQTTNILSNSKEQVSIFPNPTKDILNIELDNEISHIEILNLDGQVLYKQRVSNNKYQYNTNSLAEANYLIKIYCRDKIMVKQFSVKR